MVDNGRRALRYEAERIASSQPPLLLAALKIADTVAAGLHGRRRSGPGDAFWQYRPYQWGDNARSIDWRRSARSDPVYVRENEWEAAQTVWLWRDESPSMRYASRADLPEKEERATLLLLATAALLLRASEQVSLLEPGSRPLRGRTALDRIAEELTGRTSPTDPAAISSVPPAMPLRRHSQVILFGDFLAPLEAIEHSLAGFAAQGVRGHVVQILDPAEEALPMRGRVRFEGLEGEGDLLVRRVNRLRPGYQARLAAQKDGLRALVRRLGWTCSLHHTDKSPQTALLALQAVLSLRPDG